MNKINADQFPITFAATSNLTNNFRASDIKRFVKAIPEINEVIDANEVIVAHAKDLRRYINDFVYAAFDAVISDKYWKLGRYESLPEDVQALNYELPREARLIASFEKKLNKVKTEHALIAECRALIAELQPLADLVAFFKTVEVKATVKRAAVKAQKIEEVRVASHTDVVYQAVLPLKLMAQDRAELHFRASVRIAAEEILNAGGDLEKLVPIPEGKLTGFQEARINAARRFYVSICNLRNHRYLTLNDQLVETEVLKVRRDAAFQFEAFVSKLNDKINDVTLKAELAGDPWIGSTLTVETKNKGTQVWNTKMIVNVSKYGKVFNQFPTRLAR